MSHGVHLPPTLGTGRLPIVSGSIVSGSDPQPRIIVGGGPRSGKSVLATRLSQMYGIPLRHGDVLVQEKPSREAWSEQSQTVSEWMDEPGPWIIEGVVAPRAIRKWLKAHPDDPPPWTLLWFAEAIQPRSSGQETMAKGAGTVMGEVARAFRRHGVPIWMARQVAALPEADWRDGYVWPKFEAA